MRPWSTALLVLALTTTAACGDTPDPGGAAAKPSPGPAPTPALSKKAAEETVVRYLRSVNKANGNLDPELAAKIETGSALQVHTAQ